MSITVRVAHSEADWTQALVLLREVYVGQGFSVAAFADATFQRAVLEPEGSFLVAVDEHDTVLGAVLFLHPESSMRHLARPGEREFRLLAVGSEGRGQGAGQALVQACIDRSTAAHAQALVLWTQPTMLAAQRLYERLGFQRTPDRDEVDQRGFMRMVYRLGLG